MNQTNANGQQHGLWESYHENGLLYWKCNFLNGLFHGPFESYHDNGQLSDKGIFKDDQQIGFWLAGHWDGTIVKQFHL